MPALRPSPAERALAVAIYAPIGLGAQLLDEIPTAAIKARQHIVFARFIGKLAVDQGVRELRTRLAAPRDASQSSPTDRRGDAGVTKGEPPRAGDGSFTDLAAVAVPMADDLALTDYDQLPAAHIVGKLGGLTSAELAVIEAYEQTHRHRRTVLGKISRLREG